ncbi:MAG: GAF domain-containing protein [Verrucomicrobiaceae bacterium]|nr:GAF domain-containing protein [Verrucomicrobiaceae bacterium]
MRYSRKDELTAQVSQLPVHDFTALLQRLSEQMADMLDAMSLLSHTSLREFLGTLLEVLGTKISRILSADRGTVFLLDAPNQELWSLTSVGGDGQPVEIRISVGKGIAGRVAATGLPMIVPDAYAEPAFHREVDQRTGYRTRNILCMPLLGRAGNVLAVVQLINKAHNAGFDSADQKHFHELAEHLSPLMETWITLHQRSAEEVPLVI